MVAKETIKMLITFYNLQAGTRYRTNNEDNQRIVEAAINEAEGNISDLKGHIKTWIAVNPSLVNTDTSIYECFSSFKSKKKEEKQDPAPAPIASQVTDTQVQYSMGILEQAVIQLIAKTQSEKIEAEIMDGVEQKVRDFIKEEYGTIERKIATVVDGKHVPMQGIQHEKFENIVKWVTNDIPVFLTGPAGSGKNVLCKQVAEALGLNFYFTNAVTQEYKLTGFTDAMGNYQETQFYKAFTQGGLFMLDEMDASIPEVLVILNAAIANKYFDFPAPIGYVEAHPDFRVIAAGNTFGQGASYEYVGRNQLDAASLNRFAVVEVGYSQAIENNAACGDLELANFCREFRKAAVKTGQQIVVSYRNIGMIAKMMQIMPLTDVIRAALVKGMEKDDINVILSELKTRSKYTHALRRIADSM